jgi:hypothetical protein
MRSLWNVWRRGWECEGKKTQGVKKWQGRGMGEGRRRKDKVHN